MAMSTALKTASLLSLGIFVAIGLSISDVQASQDGRGAGRGRDRGPRLGNPRQDGRPTGRGRGRAAAVDTSTESRLFKICDHDKNKWISFREAKYSLIFDRSKFARVDADTDGAISRPEFDLFYSETIERSGSFKEPRPLAGAKEAPAAAKAPTKNAPRETQEEVNEANVETLFSEHHQRTEGAEPFPLPPRIRGPVYHFDRLDITGDGRITTEDLEWLARPAHLEVRFSSVIAILDTNNDGGVSRAEFNAAML